MFKKVLIAMAIAMTATAVWASCTYYTITDANGQIKFCTKCCYGNQCTITCT